MDVNEEAQFVTEAAHKIAAFLATASEAEARWLASIAQREVERPGGPPSVADLTACVWAGVAILVQARIPKERPHAL